MRRMSDRSNRGFTLVELLVVIGIIALLISILLPTLGRARKAANTVACAANLRSILQGMQMYASQNYGHIPGSAHTTARFTYVDPTKSSPALGQNSYGTIGEDNCPAVIQTADWASPIYKVMGGKFDEGHKLDSRIGTPATVAAGKRSRWHAVRDFPGFRCPENQVLAIPFGAVSDPMISYIPSYCSAFGFMVTHNPGTGGTPITTGWSPAMSAWNPPPGYFPKLTKVGPPALKIYIGCGGKYSKNDAGPDSDLSFSSSLGGAFSDQGAWTPFSSAWFRKSALGNGLSAGSFGPDARVYSYRHGPQRPYSKGGTFRGNFGFFDGHVELLDDLASSNPAFWLPKGSVIGTTITQINNDTRIAFKLTAMPGSSYTVP